jgi:hypothetical protein
MTKRFRYSLAVGSAQPNFFWVLATKCDLSHTGANLLIWESQLEPHYGQNDRRIFYR